MPFNILTRADATQDRRETEGRIKGKKRTEASSGCWHSQWRKESRRQKATSVGGRCLHVCMHEQTAKVLSGTCPSQETLLPSDMDTYKQLPERK